MANLTKRDLVVRISNETGIVQQDVFSVIQKTLDYITDALASGENVELRNFGVFEVRLTKSRVGRNPNRPEHDVVIPARATVKFKAGKVMKQRVLLRTEELKKSS
jgi:nucleoid DNA-binding protein